jgi:NAD(P)-dependent dehydrogenase (short-subunit alcohol dehydrogenase family)
MNVVASKPLASKTLASKSLKGKVAVVTGAGRGIGRGEAHALAAQGACVVVNDLARGMPTSAEVVAEEIRKAGGEAVAVNASVSNAEGAAAIIAKAMDTWGRLDILVNNAGFGRIAPVWDMSEADWDAVIAVNLKGTFLMTRAAAQVMRPQKSGVIINTSSESGTGDTYFCGYCAAKEGVAGFTRGVARDLARDGIRVNAIRPRAFDTGQATDEGWEKIENYVAKFKRPMTGNHFMGPIKGRSAEVGEIVAWLCTDDAAHVTGRLLVAGCGEVGVWEQPRLRNSLINREGWTVETLHEMAGHLVGGERNELADIPAEAWAIIDERAAMHIARHRPVGKDAKG